MNTRPVVDVLLGSFLYILMNMTEPLYQSVTAIFIQIVSNLGLGKGPGFSYAQSNINSKDKQLSVSLREPMLKPVKLRCKWKTTKN